MYLRRPLLALTFAVAACAFAVTASSCEKDTDCKASISCYDSVGNSVSNADVYLYAPVKSKDGKTTFTADVTANGTTDSDGNVKFNFKLPAIYDIRATGKLGSKTITGTAVIKLEEGKTVDKSVTLK